MAIGINDLDDDDFGMGFEPTEQNDVNNNTSSQQEQVTQQTQSSEDDFLSDFLKTRGIDDISRIKFEDESGNIEEKNWNSLSKEEKFNILNTPLEVVDNNQTDLSDEEIQLLNTIRQSNLTPQQYIEQFQPNQEPQYKIDDLSDDEIYLLDASFVIDFYEHGSRKSIPYEVFKKEGILIRQDYSPRLHYIEAVDALYFKQLLLKISAHVLYFALTTLW